MRFASGVVIVSLVLAHASPLRAQVDERLAAYTGRNAKGYLEPLVSAFRSNLNAGLFTTAYVPRRDLYVSLELVAMATFFSEDSRTFMATTEGDFLPVTTVEAPTVVGDNEAVYVDGVAGTQYAFPGGFDIDNIWFGAPQLRVGSIFGTEAIGRLILYDTGIEELGDLTVWGVGIRHSVSQYIERMHPVDAALAVTYQAGDLVNEGGNRVLKSSVLSASLHTGIALGGIYPYMGLTVNRFDLDLHYEFEEDWDLAPINLNFEYEEELQLTLGISYRLGVFAAYGEYNWASQNSLATGLCVTVPSNSRSATP